MLRILAWSFVGLALSSSASLAQGRTDLASDSLLLVQGIQGPLPLPMQAEMEAAHWPKVMSTDNPFHSAIKPWVFVGAQPGTQAVKQPGTQAVKQPGTRAAQNMANKFRAWYRGRSAVQYDGDSLDWSLRLDPLMEFEVGREQKETWTNIRGLRLQGHAGSTFAFRSHIWLHNAVYPSFTDAWIRQYGVVPGRMQSRLIGTQDVWDYYMATSHLAWSPNRRLVLLFGHERNFIGYGYRSMLWSDFSSPYTHLKASYTLGPMQYTYTLGKHTDLRAPRISGLGGAAASGDKAFAQKYSVNGMLDWNLGRRWQVGLYHAVVWAAQDTLGRRGIELEYLNPFVFLRPIEFGLGSFGNALMGLNIGYKITSQQQAYAQFLIDEIHVAKLLAQNGSWVNKYAWQLGWKSADLGGIRGLRLLLEHNGARPYTYSHWNSVTSYTHLNQPFAHPAGANFVEFLGRGSLLRGRWFHNLQASLLRTGLDSNNRVSVGRDPLISYINRPADLGLPIGTGIPLRTLHVAWQSGWVLHPPSNLRLEAGLVWRSQRSQGEAADPQLDRQSVWFTLGLRSRLDALYQDY